MKIKTQDLIRRALDWAAAKAYGIEFTFEEFPLHEMVDWHPSTNWRLGGPIIEQERITLRFEPECDWLFVPPQATWLANYEGVGEWGGPTPLIAAMRCFVASKMGDEVEVPKELLKHTGKKSSLDAHEPAPY